MDQGFTNLLERQGQTIEETGRAGPVPDRPPAVRGSGGAAVRGGGGGAMLRAEGRAGTVGSASVTPEQQPALDRVAQLTATMKRGERAGASLAQREIEREHQRQRQGMRINC